MERYWSWRYFALAVLGRSIFSLATLPNGLLVGTSAYLVYCFILGIWAGMDNSLNSFWWRLYHTLVPQIVWFAFAVVEPYKHGLPEVQMPIGMVTTLTGLLFYGSKMYIKISLVTVAIFLIVSTNLYVLPWSLNESSTNRNAKQNLDLPQLFTAQGNIFDKTALKGKNVFVEFYFNSCGPCLVMHKDVLKLAPQYAGSKEVVFLMINSGQYDSYDRFKALVKRRYQDVPSNFFFLFDSTRTTYKNFKIQGYPTSYFFYPDGRAAYSHVSYDEGFDIYLKQELEHYTALHAGGL